MAAKKSIMERFLGTYGTAMTLGSFGAMCWHYFNRHQFHRIHEKEEEDYREAGRPKHLKREIGAKWAEFREEELFKQFRLCGYLASAALIMSVFIRIVRLRKKTFNLSYNPHLPPISDNAISFTCGAILIDLPFYIYHLWEKEKIRKWKEQERNKNVTGSSDDVSVKMKSAMMA